LIAIEKSLKKSFDRDAIGLARPRDRVISPDFRRKFSEGERRKKTMSQPEARWLAGWLIGDA
jgi:hypothetical protein